MRLPTQLSQRKLKSNKKNFGHIFILAGSSCFSGAATLACLGALRSGAGLVTLGIPESLNNAFLKIKPLEAMTLSLPDTGNGSLSLSAFKKIMLFLKKTNVLIMGPGLGNNKSTVALIRKIVLETDRPLVLDADGLNALAGSKELLKIAQRAADIPIIMTPHLGEMARLTGFNIKEISQKRTRIAKEFSKKFGVTLVLKGHHTIVSDYSGKLYTNKTGNPGMATAGSGDVLAGIIGALLGQGLKAFQAAKFGVYLHGLAGDLAAKEKGEISLIASDIIDKIPCALKRYKSLPA